MLWIALYLPQLPLQLAQRRSQLTQDSEQDNWQHNKKLARNNAALTANAGQHREALSHPCVIVEGPSTRPVVCCANDTAKACGITIGMPVVAARALADTLKVLSRDENEEDNALHNLACWAGQFTPNVLIDNGRGLLLEVESTLRLHGGLTQLLARIRQGMVVLGYQATPGVAPTPLAATWFARARQAGLRVRMCRDRAVLPDRLASLPLPLLGWPDEIIAQLRTLGIHNIGQCLKLPRDGFIRRFGQQRRLQLDRALGIMPTPHAWFTPPENFSSRMDFGFELNDALALLFPLKRLLGELEGFLRGRGAGVQQCHLLLEHFGGRTRITLGTALPERSAERLLTLAREHLTQTTLMAPVLALAVSADQLTVFEETSEALVSDPNSRAIGWTQLTDRLTARLGEGKAYRLRTLDDHRPEQAWRRITQPKMKTVQVPTLRAPRPLWLLDPPQVLSHHNGAPVCQGQLDLLAGPERIEAGWWDTHLVSRDYYMARNPQGETLWIYCEHGRQRHWYLHGIFA